MKFSLVEIPHSEWHHLRDMYISKKKEPSSYGLLQNYIDWIAKEPMMDVKVYSLNGDWQSDGSFILIDADMETPQIYLNTLDTCSLNLKTALHCLNFRSNIFLNTLSKKHYAMLQKYILERGLTSSDVKYFGGHWYHLSKKEALKFIIRPPVDITLSKLKPQHAEQINNVWAHKGAGTIEYIRKLIRLNDSIGAFDADKKLVAWCLRTPLGALGNVQVLATHQRLGLGSLLVRYMSVIIALKDEEIVAPVKYDNIASRTMFEKLGFKPIDEAFCIEVPSNIENTE